jgi:hypothetical protein
MCDEPVRVGLPAKGSVVAVVVPADGVISSELVFAVKSLVSAGGHLRNAGFTLLLPHDVGVRVSRSRFRHWWRHQNKPTQEVRK